jgi:acyl-CoA synthetase (AMP-forming)/AMP-acid ligase II
MTFDGESGSVAAKIRHWARIRPDELALSFLADGENESNRLTYAELDDKARRLSGRLIRSGLSAKTVLLPADSSSEFIVAVCGCLYAGAVAVPSPHRLRNRGEDRIRTIIRDAEIAAMIDLGSAPADRLPEFVSEIPSLDLNDLEAEPGLLGGSSPHAPALLQYTSGSTSAPKGVVISHHNLAANIAMLSNALGVQAHSRVLTWLPLFHDMGLVGNALAALYCGVPCTVMPPLKFLQKPLRWLKAVSRFQITISGGPNFAYELCVRRAGGEPRDGLDLSSWECAVCGGEPVRASTMRSFVETFAGVGFRKTALCPSYGLAEATVFVSGGHADEGMKMALAQGSASQEIVSCGRIAPAGTVEIVDPGTHALLEDGAEGEVWVSGDHVGAGYWNKPAETAASFAAKLSNGRGKFLRTGDLGFKHKDELYITGRCKSLIIYRGSKLHPEDIEGTVGACHPDLGVAGAAFAINCDGEEQVVVAYEVVASAASAPQFESMIDQILQAVAQQYGLRLFDVVLMRSGTLPRTSSGKVQRDRCRALYLSRQLPGIEQSFSHISLRNHQTFTSPDLGPDDELMDTIRPVHRSPR